MISSLTHSTSLPDIYRHTHRPTRNISVAAADLNIFLPLTFNCSLQVLKLKPNQLQGNFLICSPLIESFINTICLWRGHIAWQRINCKNWRFLLHLRNVILVISSVFIFILSVRKMSSKMLSAKSCCCSQSGLDTWLVIRVKNMLAGGEWSGVQQTASWHPGILASWVPTTPELRLRHF